MDECDGSPCQNGGACVDSRQDPQVPITTYECRCTAGWTAADCATDVDECTSRPCANGAVCTESSSPMSNVPVDAYSCGCAAGYADGMCAYEMAASLAAVGGYGELCNVAEGNCGEDVDECASSPCQNGAACDQSVDSFTCACVAGYEGELCIEDVDECASRPWQNGAPCND